MRFLFRRRLPPSHPRGAGDRHWCGGKTINRSLAPFSILITRSFHQDRLGTNVEKVEKEEAMRFSQSRTLRCRRSPAARTKGCLCTAREGCQVGLITPVWRWSGPTSRGWGTPWCVLPRVLRTVRACTNARPCVRTKSRTAVTSGSVRTMSHCSTTKRNAVRFGAGRFLIRRAAKRTLFTTMTTFLWYCLIV